MIKTYTVFFIRLFIVIGLFFVLEQLGVDRRITSAVLLGVLSIYIIYAISKTKSYTGYLDVVLKPIMHYEAIEHLKESNKDYYNLLKAYGLYYQGLYEESKRYFDMVSYPEVSSNNSLDARYFIVKLGLLYEAGNKGEYNTVYQKALEEKVFIKANIHPDVCKVKEFILNEQYDNAIELAVLIIRIGIQTNGLVEALNSDWTDNLVLERFDNLNRRTCPQWQTPNQGKQETSNSGKHLT